MALDYTDLFACVGALIKGYNDFYTDAQAIAGRIDTIQDAFGDEQQQGAIEGLRDTREDAWLGEYAGRRSILAGYAEKRLTERATVVEEIGAVSSDLAAVLDRLIESFVADSETVESSTTSVGSVTANAGNVGDGTVLVTTLLDQVTSPGGRAGINFRAHHLYGDVLSELTINETMEVRCTADSYADGRSEGAEVFNWQGEVADSQHGVAAAEGSGSIGSPEAIHANVDRYLSNADFETFTTANTPDSWTIVAGTPGTHILEATSGNKYHGSKGLNFRGNGVLASIEISQALAAGSLKAGRRCAVTCRIKADATIAAGDLTIQLEGTGYTAGGSEKITVAAGSLPTSWTLKHFFVLLPANLPSDLKLVIRWNGTPTNAKNLYIDDVAFGEVNYGGGLGIVVVRGATPFVRNDRFTFALTVTEGVVQKFFRRVFGVQLPSDGSPTIADSVAT